MEQAGAVPCTVESAVFEMTHQAGTPTFTGYVTSHPDVKLIVTDHGGLTATAQTYLSAAGKQPENFMKPDLLRKISRH